MKVLKQYEDKETEAMRYGTLMHEAAEKYVRDKEPLPRAFEYVQSALDSLTAKKGEKLCEFKMGLTESLEPCGFYADNVWWRGIADLVILDTDDQLAWVIDYKTGKSKEEDKNQVNYYKELLSKIYKGEVYGFIAYIDPILIIKT